MDMQLQVDTSRMSGRDLFDHYAFVGEDQEYRNTVLSAYMELKEELFPMLEQCEREGKRIVLRYDAALQDAGVLDCPFEIVIA